MNGSKLWVCKMTLKITCLKLLPHLAGANKLNVLECGSIQCFWPLLYSQNSFLCDPLPFVVHTKFSDLGLCAAWRAHFVCQCELTSVSQSVSHPFSQYFCRICWTGIALGLFLLWIRYHERTFLCKVEGRKKLCFSYVLLICLTGFTITCKHDAQAGGCRQIT